MSCHYLCPICSRMEEQLGQREFDAWWAARFPNLGKRWTDDELLELAAMRSAGVSMEIREKHFGRTSHAIANAIQRHLPRLSKEAQR